MNERLLFTDALRALEQRALASLPAGTLMALSLIHISEPTRPY